MISPVMQTNRHNRDIWHKFYLERKMVWVENEVFDNSLLVLTHGPPHMGKDRESKVNL